MKKNKIFIRLPESIHKQMLDDLYRAHSFAYERVGFLYTRSIQLPDCTLLILAFSYQPIADDQYIDDATVGAKIGSTAIRSGMQYILSHQCGSFHVHLHDHSGKPGPSGVDRKSLPAVVHSFSNANPRQAHGIIILSRDSIYAEVLSDPSTAFRLVDRVTIIGYPMKLITHLSYNKSNPVFKRQSFLGNHTEEVFRQIRIGIVGYGGGGSHIGQQLAHLGIEQITVFDDDSIEDTNHNRLIGGWFRDIAKKLKKTLIAKRTIRNILPSAKLNLVNDRWQNAVEDLHACDIIIGCVDTYLGREQLENECRRYLIPYIDIGMDVYKVENNLNHMSGQVILSMPFQPCMKCTGFLHPSKLAGEAAKYGNVGGRPQVVWANGVLASSVVGILVDIITGWTGQKNKQIYLAYDGNEGLLQQHVRIQHLGNKQCFHYPADQIGPPIFQRL